MAKRRKRKQRTPASMERAIRTELRTILRQYDELITPLNRFELHPRRSQTEPRFYVAFDCRDRREITGLRTSIKTLVLPDEYILENILRLTQSVWHLKDRLNQLANAKHVLTDVAETVMTSDALQICADLANEKKHGACENRSGLSPALGTWTENEEARREGVVEFDTSKSGVLELYYEGSTKTKELLVTNRAPIPFRVDILLNDGTSYRRDAVTVIYDAFKLWLPLIDDLEILDPDDPECDFLRSRLFPSAA